MTGKKIISAAAALALAVSGFGAYSLGERAWSDTAITASALTSGSFEYELLADGTAEITGYNGSDTTLTIPSTLDGKKVTSIADIAFLGCTNIASVSVPSTITHIGADAFDGTAWLESEINKSPLVIVNGILIHGRTAAGAVTIPDTVTQIADSAFGYNNGITSVTIPGSVKSIGASAFNSCDNLKSVTMKKGVETIGRYAFYFCSGLTELTIADTVTFIGNYALNYTGMKQITIPASVTEIEKYAIDTYSGIKLRCYKDSASEKYAKDNGFDYEIIEDKPVEEDVLYGDVNMDEKVDMQDLALLQQYLAKWEVTIDEKASDVDLSGTIEMQDLALLQQYLAKWDVKLGK